MESVKACAEETTTAAAEKSAKTWFAPWVAEATPSVLRIRLASTTNALTFAILQLLVELMRNAVLSITKRYASASLLL